MSQISLSLRPFEAILEFISVHLMGSDHEEPARFRPTQRLLTLFLPGFGSCHRVKFQMQCCLSLGSINERVKKIFYWIHSSMAAFTVACSISQGTVCGLRTSSSERVAINSKLKVCNERPRSIISIGLPSPAARFTELPLAKRKYFFPDDETSS